MRLRGGNRLFIKYGFFYTRRIYQRHYLKCIKIHCLLYLQIKRNPLDCEHMFRRHKVDLHPSAVSLECDCDNQSAV